MRTYLVLVAQFKLGAFRYETVALVVSLSKLVECFIKLLKCTAHFRDISLPVFLEIKSRSVEKLSTKYFYAISAVCGGVSRGINASPAAVMDEIFVTPVLCLINAAIRVKMMKTAWEVNLRFMVFLTAKEC